ncbi:uncharacterized protein K452DRAFT_223706 [Aplosporella prunicola CBS 121167]|uniref:DUF6594 domain-containing protein n=1 Tax=Aplosporella prunicola CBS 121167 TaxID=1176127 RepID=A0A6A6BLH7_9PEZI|nr:uncharacterized protein K452DRAFT_223706 [Aplosporella prunicola CBS 121167]KAF2144253.1 hypothetical protein K452DRAFT_223706 [Aplosporella prunicola CBS 121167]
MGPYTEVAIFRRFGSLNMINLLFLQAELVELERKYKDIYLFDAKGAPGIPAQPFSHNFKSLRESDKTTNHEQLDMLKEIQLKLAAYNTALLHASKLSQLRKPEADDLRVLREWLVTTEGGPFLRVTENGTWDDERDLVTINPQLAEDEVIVPWFTNGFLDIYHAFFGSRSRSRKRVDEENILVYDDTHVERVNKIMITIIASILPTIAIIVLYAVKDTWRRVYIMIGFTAAFAFSLAIFTPARRLEIFASTAAFAAVEVVFIGSVDS